MGLTVTSFHARDRDTDAVIRALRFGRVLPSWVSSNDSVWVSIFPASAEGRDPRVLNRIGTILSRSLDTYVWSVLLHDSTVFQYTVFEQGEIVAEYDSFPELSPSMKNGYRDLTAGRPGLMSRLCPGNTSRREIEEVLYRKPRGEALSEIMEEEKAKDEDELYSILPADYVHERIMEKRGWPAEEERLAEVASILDVREALLSFGMLEGYYMEEGVPLEFGDCDFIRVT